MCSQYYSLMRPLFQCTRAIKYYITITSLLHHYCITIASLLHHYCITITSLLDSRNITIMINTFIILSYSYGILCIRHQNSYIALISYM